MNQGDYDALCRILQDAEVMYANEHAFSDEEVPVSYTHLDVYKRQMPTWKTTAAKKIKISYISHVQEPFTVSGYSASERRAHYYKVPDMEISFKIIEWLREE